MGAKTKIDWADATWNPITGCLHGCEYCYARRIAERFGGASETHNNETCHECQWETEGTGELHDLDEPIYDYDNSRNAPYPFEFDPTFHRYRLDIPEHWKKPKSIFVCSMADLFGDWVPDEWIEEVLEACDNAAQHRYLFLTKNPSRYKDIQNLLPIHRRPPAVAEMWFGTSYTGESRYYHPRTYRLCKQFVSVEPLLNAPSEMDCHGLAICNQWVIIGAETGNRKNKVIPEKSWIDRIVAECKQSETPVFMKENLRSIMGADFRQEFPWE